MFSDDSDDLRIIFEVEEHIADLIDKEGLHIGILEEVIVLDVYFQGLSLVSGVLGVKN